MSARRLDSWKEIADYFGRDRTVVARWERERGLPVHRVPGGVKPRVFAYTDELDAWLQSSRPGETEVTEATGDGRQAVDPGPQTAHAAFIGLWRPRTIAAGVVALVIIGVSAAVWAARNAPGPVASVAFTADALIALDDHRREVFRADFRNRIFLPAVPSTIGLAGRRDLDGDGKEENLITVPLKMGDGTQGGMQDRLEAYRNDGTLMWSRSNDFDPTFGAGRFGPGYHTTATLTFDYQGVPLIAWAQAHHTWWPTILKVLDASGGVRSTWTHSGVFFALSYLPSPEGPLLFAGGVSNSQSSGALLVLNLDDASGHGPEAVGSPFACLDCTGSGRPAHYFTFPPTEMSAAYGVPYSRTYAIHATPSGVEVRVRQGSLEPHQGVDAFYNFDRDFHLAGAHVADDYWLVHRQLEGTGALDHSVDVCPERGRPLVVREWADGAWRTLTTEER